MNLLNKKISIIGLGYVGLPLAVAFAKKFQHFIFQAKEDTHSEGTKADRFYNFTFLL